MPKRDQPAEPATTSLVLPTLGEELQAEWDRYLREKARAAKGYQADAKAKEAKGTILEAMGAARMARLPDGRIIQRLPKSRQMPSKPAHTQTWEELVEFEQLPAAA